MGNVQNSMLLEIHEMLKVISDKQDQLMENVKELREGQKRLQEEIKLNNLVLNTLPLRNEIVN